MRPRTRPAVTNHLPRILRQRGITWTDLARRTRLSRGQMARIRAHDANPRLVVAQRIAAALDLPVDSLWRLVDPWPR